MGPAPPRTVRNERPMKHLTNKGLAAIVRMARATATVMGFVVMLALTLGLASAALAGNGVGARLDLGKVNAVNAITSLQGTVAGPTFTFDNKSASSGATALDLRVEPGKPPMKVNSTTEVKRA
jgi:hypothetical protein